MGGMDNRTSIELARKKRNRINYLLKKNEGLYEEYLSSGKQYTQTFLDWKNEKFKTKKKMKKTKPEKMQKPLSKKGNK